LILSGVGLNAIGVFMSVIFGVKMAPTLLVLGVTVTVVAFAGGAFAVLASDFVQMLLVVTITLVPHFSHCGNLRWGAAWIDFKGAAI